MWVDLDFSVFCRWTVCLWNMFFNRKYIFSPGVKKSPCKSERFHRCIRMGGNQNDQDQVVNTGNSQAIARLYNAEIDCCGSRLIVDHLFRGSLSVLSPNYLNLR